MPVPLLEVRNLRVEFPTRRGRLLALDDVSFSIAPGEVLGVVGESGAGKSLTGAAIIGLLEAPGRVAGGEILLDGRRIDQLDDEAMRRIRGKEIGAIFQDPLTSLNPLYTVGQQLIETIQTHLDLSTGDARQRAIDLLESTGIPGARQRFDQYPHQFSGGMRQRVVIALALAAGPKLIVADEPTTALDVSIQAQIITLLKTLCREHGTAIMLVTHDMGVIADRFGRRTTLGTLALLIAVFSAFVPSLLNGGESGQNMFVLIGFGLLGLSYGQAAGAVTANFPARFRYTGAALTSDLAWLVGAGFAPLVALGLSAHFGLAYVSLYLLSGAVGSLAALSLNRALEIRD